MAAALACNDHDDFWFREPELGILTELCDTMYDATTYYKHRAEGGMSPHSVTFSRANQKKTNLNSTETNSTFAYAPASLRTKSYRQCRQILWELDASWATSSPRRCIINFIRTFGGPIHMMMRRYRFAEDGLTIGNPETDGIVEEAERNVKLWNRVGVVERGGEGGVSGEGREGFEGIVTRKDTLLFEGMAEMLEGEGVKRCGKCSYRRSYGARVKGEFGGVKLCGECETQWKTYLESFPERAAAVFSGFGDMSAEEQSHTEIPAAAGKKKRGCEVGAGRAESSGGAKKRRRI